MQGSLARERTQGRSVCECAKRLVKRRALPNVCNTVYIQRFAPERFADVQPKKGEFCSLHSYQTFCDQTFGAQNDWHDASSHAISSFEDDSDSDSSCDDEGPTLRQRRDKWRRLTDMNIPAEADPWQSGCGVPAGPREGARSERKRCQEPEMRALREGVGVLPTARVRGGRDNRGQAHHRFMINNRSCTSGSVLVCGEPAEAPLAGTERRRTLLRICLYVLRAADVRRVPRPTRDTGYG